MVADPSLLMVELEALRELRAMAQPIDPGALAARLGEHEEAVTLLLGRLADRGLVRREELRRGFAPTVRWRLVTNGTSRASERVLPSRLQGTLVPASRTTA